MKIQFGYVILIMVVALSSCATMRYESFDSGVSSGEV